MELKWLESLQTMYYFLNSQDEEIIILVKHFFFSEIIPLKIAFVWHILFTCILICVEALTFMYYWVWVCAYEGGEGHIHVTAQI